jgi:segregation and condensation protein B
VSDTELRNIIEAALFAAPVPLTVKNLQSLFETGSVPESSDIRQVLTLLAEDYAERGLELQKVGNAYRFQTQQKYAQWMRRLSEARPPRYSRALLETLAIIAYRQPVTRGDIEEIRGVTVSSDIMRTLLDREWIRQVGVREVPGRPGLFGTTQSFLEYFNLNSLTELPELTEMRDELDIARELNIDLPLPMDSGDETPTSEEAAGDEEPQEPQERLADAPSAPVVEDSGQEGEDNGESQNLKEDQLVG